MMKVKLSDIIDALMSTNQESEYFLDKKTAAIEWVSDMAMTESEQQAVYDRLDAHGFYRLPTQYEIRDYGIMEDFADTLSGAAREKLANALRGRGAFRRFKDTVHYMGIAEQWYAFQDEAYKKKAVGWCEENGIEYEE